METFANSLAADADDDHFSDAIGHVASSPLEPLHPPPQSNPQPPLSSSTLPPQAPPSKKPKKKSSTTNSVWTKPTSRKKPKKSGRSTNPTTTSATGVAGAGAASAANPSPDHSVFITPVPRFPDKSDDSPLSPILLSRSHKAEKVELSDDRLTAGSTKGYRMVRATRGVLSGSWYFEIKVLHLGPTGHTRLGWVMDKGDLQAPVGYDRHGYGYRDMDGSKVHRALRERYGEGGGYGEGDVVGFYVNLPEGEKYAPKLPHLVWYKGQRYMYSAAAGGGGKDEAPKVVPGSEISFFRNGVCQGVAFTDLAGGRYYPAASMYTLPNQPNCEVRFNFGPDFEAFPRDFGGRPIPRPMSEVPYHGYGVKAEEAPMENGFHEKIN